MKEREETSDLQAKIKAVHVDMKSSKSSITATADTKPDINGDAGEKAVTFENTEVENDKPKDDIKEKPEDVVNSKYFAIWCDGCGVRLSIILPNRC
jgi:hypothetical protein